MVYIFIFIALNIFVQKGNGQRAVRAFGCHNQHNTDSLRALYLKEHNDNRIRLANGVSPGKQGALNKAKNMYKLEWSCKLENMAQDHIKSCDGDLATLRSYGRNSMMFSVASTGFDSSQSNFKYRPLIKNALNKWWNEAKDNGLDDGNKFRSEKICYFANMAYFKSSLLGCAHNKCGDIVQVFCLYDRIGVFMNRPIWRTGNPCRSDEECTVFPNSTCDNKLCVKPKEAPDDGKNNICKHMEGMTDAVRSKFLDMHNYYRSQVALGRAVDPKTKTKKVATAAKMQKLKYACRLEKSAMDYAKQCKFAHSGMKGVGENLYMVAIPGFQNLKLASMATEDWFEELEEHGVGDRNRYSSDFSKHGAMVGHYTQLVWQNTKQLGCAIVDCADKNMTLVVCHYSNPGNYVDELIYLKGEPCSKCPSPTVVCHKEEGLCFSPN